MTLFVSLTQFRISQFIIDTKEYFTLCFTSQIIIPTRKLKALFGEIIAAAYKCQLYGNLFAAEQPL